MYSEGGFTIVEILVATTMLVVLIGAGGYVLYTKNTGSTLEEDIIPTSENTEGTAEGPDSSGGNAESTSNSAGEETPVSSANTPEINVVSDSINEPASETSSESSGEPVQTTSPFWDNILDNIYTGAESESAPSTEPEPESTPEPEPPISQTTTVTYNNSGFSPTVVTISQDGAILFVNNSNHGMWVSSNSHPTHTGYPEKSPSDCLGSSFDTCVNINPGDSWQFVFNSIGSWGYHNHTRVGKKGTVIVQ